MNGGGKLAKVLIHNMISKLVILVTMSKHFFLFYFLFGPHLIVGDPIMPNMCL